MLIQSQASLSFKQRFNLNRFFKGEAPVSGALVLTQRRVFILPTLRGLSLVLTVLLLLLMAFVYNNNLVYFLGFLLASIFFVTILHTYRSLAGLVVQAGYVKPVFAGEEAHFTLSVRNATRWPKLDLWVILQKEQRFTLEAGESTTLLLPVTSHQRGKQAMGTVTLFSAYPFGLFRAWSPLRFQSHVLVYPKPSSTLLALPDRMGAVKEGLQFLEQSGQEDFNGLRDYQPGDSLRHIHWKAYAKAQGLMSRLYANEAGGAELWLDYAQVPGADVEDRLSQLCRWILDAQASGMRYGLLLPGRRIELNSGEQHQSDCLEALALF